MDLTEMSFRYMLETAISVGGGVTAVGGVAIWLFREKVAKWVMEQVVLSSRVGAWVDARVVAAIEETAPAVIDTRIAERFGSTTNGWDDWRREKDARDRSQEDRLGKLESAIEMIALVAKGQDETVRRTTQVLEAVNTKLNDHGESLAKQGATLEIIAATMDRRNRPR